MKQHRFYRIINIVILPFAAYLGVQVLMSIFVALANPALLLVSFILACIPLYAFTANYFYNRSVKLKQPSKPSLKDFIKVNAIVSLLFAALILFSTSIMLMVLGDKALLQQMKDQLVKSSPTPIPEGELVRYLKVFSYVFLPFSILLITHIILTFRILKQYRHMFGTPSTNDPE